MTDTAGSVENTATGPQNSLLRGSEMLPTTPSPRSPQRMEKNKIDGRSTSQLDTAASDTAHPLHRPFVGVGASSGTISPRTDSERNPSHNTWSEKPPNTEFKLEELDVDSATLSRPVASTLAGSCRKREAYMDDDRWMPVSPSKAGRVQRAGCSSTPVVSYTSDVRKPLVWAGNEAELTEAIPGICSEPNITVRPFNESPLLYLKGHMWGQDRWSSNGEGACRVLELTFNRRKVPLVPDTRPTKRRRIGALPNETCADARGGEHSVIELEFAASGPVGSEDTMETVETCFNLGSTVQRVSTQEDIPGLTNIAVQTHGWRSLATTSVVSETQPDHLPSPHTSCLDIDDAGALVQSLESLQLRNRHSAAIMSSKSAPVLDSLSGRAMVKKTRESLHRVPSLSYSNTQLSDSSGPVLPIQMLAEDEETYFQDPGMFTTALHDETDVSDFPSGPQSNPSIDAQPSTPQNFPAYQTFSDCPSDIALLRSSSQAGLPVRLLASKDWSLFPCALPTNCSVAFLGFFEVSELSSEEVTSGEWQFRFRFEWLPGAASHESRMWWSGDQTGQYSLTQAKFEIAVLDLIPQGLVNPPPPNTQNRVQRGWLCHECGKINRRVILCGWICTNCAAKGPVEAPTCAPATRKTFRMPIALVEYPPCVHPTRQTWDDDTVTYEFHSQTAVLKHIAFRGEDDSSVLSYADSIFQGLQQDHQMKRNDAGSTRHVMVFSHIAVYARDARDAPSKSGSSDVLKMAIDYLLGRVSCYGEEESLSPQSARVSSLEIFVWVPIHKQLCAPPAKNRYCLAKSTDATQRPVLLMCLGADINVEIRPKKGFASALSQDDPLPPNTEMLSTGREDLDVDFESDGLPAVVINDDEGAVAAARPPISTTASVHNGTIKFHSNKKKASTTISGRHGRSLEADREKLQFRGAKKFDGPCIRITLVHGDILSLQGDVFNCTFYRNGFSILLLAATRN